ncbi:hypothetical protein HJFPF1_02379 [Paramyrothecium foliicola]|nr:hypothetical protein HJFPF1_02379 [Paramyrothecium foliicola]
MPPYSKEITQDAVYAAVVCTTLASIFPNRTHYAIDDGEFTIWDQKQAETNYMCRVQPTSVEEVSRVLQILVYDWCRFAVKGGGHSRFPDDSVSLSGVTIDLGLINSIVVSDDRTTSRVGGGALSRQVFAALDSYSLAYLGGRVGQVGIGGFTLGGGTSVLTSKHGWALDHVLEFEVVLPNATIVTASEFSHPELYYALRGGGNNFGIVTSFNVSVFPQRQVYTGSRTFGDNQVGRVLEEAEKIFTIQDAEDVNIGLEYRYTYTQQSGWSISTTQRYLEAVLHPQVFDELNSIPALGNLNGEVNSLANSTRFAGPLGTTSLADDFIAAFRQAAEEANALHPFLYINYANKGQDVFKGYGEVNQRKLVEIQEAIDPDGVFTSGGLWTGFFKVR